MTHLKHVSIFINSLFLCNSTHSLLQRSNSLPDKYRRAHAFLYKNIIDFTILQTFIDLMQYFVSFILFDMMTMKYITQKKRTEPLVFKQNEITFSSY